MKQKSELKKAIEYIESRSTLKPQIAIILGSGLGSFADNLEKKLKISTKDIPYYPGSTVEGHAGQLVFGYSNKNPIIALQGRTHFYEGYSLDRVTFIIRILNALKVTTLIITNAAGGINPLFKPGDLMLIKDQINFIFKNPTFDNIQPGTHPTPDMSQAYTSKYYESVQKVALKKNIDLKSGTLFVSTGPSYETASEVKMAYKLGADAASMSTVPEVIVANQCGIDVIGISCITNMATGITREPLDHNEVTMTAQLAKNKFLGLTTGIIDKLSESV